MYQEIVLLIQSSSLFLSSANRFHLLLFLTVTVLFYQPSVIFLIFLVTRWRMTSLVLSLWGSLFQAFSELGRSAKNGERQNKGKLNARRRLLFVREKWQLKLIVIFFCILIFSIYCARSGEETHCWSIPTTNGCIVKGTDLVYLRLYLWN